jgi:DNA-directed RNA polymerase specialized sigma24 family protein
MAKRSSPFPETRWSLLGRAGAADDAVRREALGELIELYLASLRRFLVRGMRIDRTQADDLLQEFMVAKVIGGNLLSAADPARGRFRNLLIRALRNHTISELRRAWGDAEPLEPVEDLAPFPSPEAGFDQLLQCLWARQVLCAAAAEMRRECQGRGRDDVWEVFRRRLADPALHGADPAPYEELVRDLHIATPRAAINLLTTATRMFRRHLVAVVASYAAPGADLDAELRDLGRFVTGDGMALVWGIPEDDEG